MAKAKRITRTRGGGPGVEGTEGERGSHGKPWTTDLLILRALSPNEGAAGGAPRLRRGVWRPIRSYVATAFNQLAGELAGLSETRPALGRHLLLGAREKGPGSARQKGPTSELGSPEVPSPIPLT